MKRLIFVCLVLAVAAGAEAQYVEGTIYRTADSMVFQSGTTLTLQEGSTFTNAESSVFTLGADESIVFTVRSAAADLTPTVSCTIGEAATYCRSVAASTTDVAAGATVAVKAVETSNNADGDESWCRVYIQMQ